MDAVAHEVAIKVYYGDTDAGGVVYYGTYLRFLEQGRTEYMAARGIDVAANHRAGSIFVVAHVDIRYIRPAHLGETVAVRSEVREVGGASLGFRQSVMRGGETLAEADVTLAHTDATGRPARLPTALRAALASVGA
jgi:acyl-CoA thioester hydrolase